MKKYVKLIDLAPFLWTGPTNFNDFAIYERKGDDLFKIFEKYHNNTVSWDNWLKLSTIKNYNTIKIKYLNKKEAFLQML